MLIKFENKTNGRFYYIKVYTDLLGDKVLTIIRGGKYFNIIRHYGYKDPLLIDAEIKRISKIRLQRGYLIDG